MQLCIVLLALFCLLVQGQQQSSAQCSYSDPSGYNLNWSVANGVATFNFSYTNFPSNSASGVAFGNNLNDGLDVILVQLNGYQVQVVDSTMVGMNSPKADSPSTVTTASSSFQNNVVRAQFSRPLVGRNPSQKNLSDCVLWSFLVNPVPLQNGQLTRQPDTSKQMQICNIEYMCQGDNSQMNQMNANSGNFNQQANPVLYNPPMNQPNQWNQAQGYNQPNNNFNGQQQQQPGFNSPQYQPMNNQYQNQMAGGYSNQQYQQNNQYQQQNRMYDSSTQNPLGQGNNFGYNKNTATPPPLQPYTGAPFAYSTTMNPNGLNGQNGQFQNGQQYQNQNQGFQGNNVMYDARNQNGYAQNNYQYQPQTSTQSPWNTNNNNNNNSSMFSSAYNSVTRYFNPNQNQNQNTQNGNQYQAQNYPAQQNQAYYNPQQQLPYGTNQQMYYNPQPTGYQQNYNQRQGYYRFKRWAERAKRQTQGYQPTNNIYGYNYDSSSQSGGSIPLVVNPNYKYLSGPAAEEYSRNYATAAQQYDATTGTVPGQQNPNQMNINGNSPILSNDQQNQVNYQQIQRDYQQNPNQTAGQVYTNNIYGYGYSSGSSANLNQQFYQPTNYVSSSTQSPLNSNNVYLQRDPTGLYYPSNPSATTSSPINTLGVQRDATQQQNQYQSQSDLKQTVLRDPTQRPQSVLRDQPATQQQNGQVYYYDGNARMYYPYRTTTTFNGNTGNPVTSNSFNDNTSSNVNPLLYDPTTRRMNDGSDPCQLEDPYWCGDYVNIYLNSAIQLNNQSKQTACSNMIASLAESYNGCCATVRNAGCN